MTGIPLARPDLGDLELEYVSRAVTTSWISSIGEFLERFEEEFARLCGTRHAYACANGTVALHLALLALGIGPGDEVIVPSLTYIASVNAITYVGAQPIFVDADPDTWCLDVDAVEAALTDRTKAIMAVHLYGQLAPMDELLALARPRGIKIVEDAAEAPLATYRGRTTGSLGDIGTFSFYGNKIFTSGEGGAVTLDPDELGSQVHLLRGQGMDPNRRYYFPIVGYNYRLTNIAAALLCAQFERRGDILRQRARIVERYDANLSGVASLVRQGDRAECTRAHWLYSVLVDDTFGLSRDEVAERLAAQGVETRPFFIPIHTLPPYQHAASRAVLPVTTRLARQGINLPTFSSMTTDDVDRVCEALVSLQR
jgi:perosamine synthetase